MRDQQQMDEIKDLDELIENFSEDLHELFYDILDRYSIDREEKKFSFIVENMNYIKKNYVDKEILRKRIETLENMNKSLEWAEDKNLEPETYIIRSNKAIISTLKEFIAKED